MAAGLFKKGVQEGGKLAGKAVIAETVVHPMLEEAKVLWEKTEAFLAQVAEKNGYDNYLEMLASQDQYDHGLAAPRPREGSALKITAGAGEQLSNVRIMKPSESSVTPPAHLKKSAPANGGAGRADTDPDIDGLITDLERVGASTARLNDTQSLALSTASFKVTPIPIYELRIEDIQSASQYLSAASGLVGALGHRKLANKISGIQGAIVGISSVMVAPNPLSLMNAATSIVNLSNCFFGDEDDGLGEALTELGNMVQSNFVALRAQLGAVADHLEYRMSQNTATITNAIHHSEMRTQQVIRQSTEMVAGIIQQHHNAVNFKLDSNFERVHANNRNLGEGLCAILRKMSNTDATLEIIKAEVGLCLATMQDNYNKLNAAFVAFSQNSYAQQAYIGNSIVATRTERHKESIKKISLMLAPDEEYSVEQVRELLQQLLTVATESAKFETVTGGDIDLTSVKLVNNKLFELKQRALSSPTHAAETLLIDISSGINLLNGLISGDRAPSLANPSILFETIEAVMELLDDYLARLSKGTFGTDVIKKSTLLRHINTLAALVLEFEQFLVKLSSRETLLALISPLRQLLDSYNLEREAALIETAQTRLATIRDFRQNKRNGFISEIDSQLAPDWSIHGTWQTANWPQYELFARSNHRGGQIYDCAYNYYVYKYLWLERRQALLSDHTGSDYTLTLDRDESFFTEKTIPEYRRTMNEAFNAYKVALLNEYNGTGPLKRHISPKDAELLPLPISLIKNVKLPNHLLKLEEEGVGYFDYTYELFDKCIKINIEFRAFEETALALPSVVKVSIPIPVFNHFYTKREKSFLLTTSVPVSLEENDRDISIIWSGDAIEKYSTGIMYDSEGRQNIDVSFGWHTNEFTLGSTALNYPEKMWDACAREIGKLLYLHGYSDMTEEMVYNAIKPIALTYLNNDRFFELYKRLGGQPKNYIRKGDKYQEFEISSLSGLVEYFCNTFANYWGAKQHMGKGPLKEPIRYRDSLGHPVNPERSMSAWDFTPFKHTVKVKIAVMTPNKPINPINELSLPDDLYNPLAETRLSSVRASRMNIETMAVVDKAASETAKIITRILLLEIIILLIGREAGFEKVQDAAGYFKKFNDAASSHEDRLTALRNIFTHYQRFVAEADTWLSSRPLAMTEVLRTYVNKLASLPESVPTATKTSDNELKAQVAALQDTVREVSARAVASEQKQEQMLAQILMMLARPGAAGTAAPTSQVATTFLPAAGGAEHFAGEGAHSSL